MKQICEKIIGADGMLSVVIRNRNEQDYIGFAIQSIVDNLTDYEIIVVDNNSTDDSLSIVKSFNFEPITIIEVDDYTPGRSINLGARAASGDHVLILSAHAQIVQFNQDDILKFLGDYVCVFGNQIPIWNGKKISKRYLWSHFSNKKTKNMYSELEKRYFLHNALAVYKKDTLKKFPFDENLTSKEDRYWANKIIKKKMNFIYDPELIAEHQYTIHGNTWKGIA